MTTVLGITSYLKGEEYLREAKRQGAYVILLTEEKLADAPWPREFIDQVFLMPDLSKLPDVIYAVAYLMRTHKIDRIAPLDEYDVEMAAILREHLRIHGLNISQTKIIRDKLIMRESAAAAGILVPPFSRVVHHADVADYMQRIPPPWVLKPRLEAGAMGIKRVYTQDELWGLINVLGDQQSFRVLEQYLPGDVYHCDALTVDGETIFTSEQRYGAPPLNVAHDGGVFMTYTLDPDSDDARAIQKLNRRVIEAFGLKNTPTHAEFIKSHADGQFYFLEIAARVGGAHIAELVEYATGINLWREWGRLDVAQSRGESYTLPEVKRRAGGLLVSLARQEWPDMSAYTDPEIVWRIHKKQHAGMIVTSESAERVQELLNGYRERFVHDFLAVAPPRDKPTD
jgi:hypothetical protein